MGRLVCPRSHIDTDADRYTDCNNIRVEKVLDNSDEFINVLLFYG
jgi:hypothetical protein